MATDSYKFEMTGLSAFLIGAVGANGAMGSVLAPYLVKDATAAFNIAEPTQTDINIYQSDTAYAVLNGKQPKDFSLELYGLKYSDLPTFMGGSYVASAVITATAFVVGTAYTIKSVGTTDFTLIGAASNTIGVVFIATGVGAGTGTAASPDRWNAPTTIPVITKSVKLQSKDSLGNTIGLVFPKCQLVGSISGSLSKDDLLGLKLKVVVLAPVDGSGNVLSSWGIDGEVTAA